MLGRAMGKRKDVMDKCRRLPDGAKEKDDLKKQKMYLPYVINF